MQRRIGTVVALQLLAACAPDALVTQVALELHAPSGCELGASGGLELRALGDFPARREEFEARDPATFDRFPIGTRELVIEGRFADDQVAGGRVPIAAAVGGEPLPIVLLPESRSCPLGDPGALAREGAVVAPLPDGGFLIAGGAEQDGEVSSRAWVLRAGRTLLDEVTDGMLQRRREASATRVGAMILVAGGASDPTGDAEQTYEVYDVARGAFAGELSRRLSVGSRMEHGAALLPDGTVLLAGGRSEPAGQPLATAQLVSLDPQRQTQPSDLNTARVAPQVLVLDSGAVVVAGGRDARDALVPALERYDAAATEFVTLRVDLPVYEEAVAVGLPGARLAWLGCDTQSRAVCGVTLVLLRDDEPVMIDVPLAWEDRAPRGLRELRAIALEDGRILLTGRDTDVSSSSRAFVIDAAERSIETYDASRAPTVLLALEDGAIAELDPVGASLRRVGSVSVYDSPDSDLVSGDGLRASVDAPERWERTDDGLRALVTGARLDVPRLRFGGLRAELSLSGSVHVQLNAPDAPELSIQLGSGTSAAPGCDEVPAGATTYLERRGGSVRVWTERPAVSCTVAWPASGLVGLSLEAAADTLVRRLVIKRL